MEVIEITHKDFSITRHYGYGTLDRIMEIIQLCVGKVNFENNAQKYWELVQREMGDKHITKKLHLDSKIPDDVLVMSVKTLIK